MEAPDAKVVLVDDDGRVETLWAFSLGGDRYRLDNSPWYAYGVSMGDVVEAPAGEDGRPTFAKVLEKSGFRTLRIAPEPEASDELLKGLRALRCDFEGANRRYLTLSIPADVQLQGIIDLLNERGVNWEYADPTYESVQAGA